MPEDIGESRDSRKKLRFENSNRIAGEAFKKEVSRHGGERSWIGKGLEAL